MNEREPWERQGYNDRHAVKMRFFVSFINSLQADKC